MSPSPALLRWREAGQRFAFAGHEIFCREEGAGEPLLLVHGYPTASWDWHAIWPALAQRYRLLAPDLLGFGFSAKPRAHAYAVMEQADLVESLALARGITRAHLLAHDYGDTVAQELLARSNAGGPLRLHTLTLLNGGIFPEMHRARLIQKLLLTPLGPAIAALGGRRAFARAFSAVFGAQSLPAAAELDDFWYLVDHDGGRRVLPLLQRYIPERRANRARWVGALIRTTTPLKLINGPADPVSGAHAAARYRELVPVADVSSLPGIGHYPHVEDPAGVLAALLPFLAAHPIAGVSGA